MEITSPGRVRSAASAFTGTFSLEGPLYLSSVTFLADVPTQAQLLKPSTAILGKVGHLP